MAIKKGRQTISFEKGVYVDSYAAVVGKKEGEGPLFKYFDKIFKDEYLGTDSFEKAESMLQKKALEILLKKANKKPTDIDYIFAGDLLNQCMGSSFSIRDFGVAFIGLYGACSTMILSMCQAALYIESGAANHTIAMTSSHFCSSERQFRFPLEYGCQRTPTSQWTVTGAGATLLSNQKSHIKLNSFLIGKIIDYEIKDPNNMGAAMAPAAAETIRTYLEDTGRKISDFDYIFTGDLGEIGSKLLVKILKAEKIDISKKHRDCGKIIFDIDNQEVAAGGSGCGCVGSVLNSYIFSKLKNGDYKRILVCATGALLSTLSSQQGESIPGIAHLIEFEYCG